MRLIYLRDDRCIKGPMEVFLRIQKLSRVKLTRIKIHYKIYR